MKTLLYECKWRMIFISLSTLWVVVGSACSISKGKEEAEKAVNKLHSQYNALQFHDTYTESAEEMKKDATEEKFVAFMTALHKKLGTVQGTKQVGFQILTNPNRTYIILVYETNFEQDKGTEQFMWLIDKNRAFLVSYNISSPSLLLNSSGMWSASTSC